MYMPETIFWNVPLRKQKVISPFSLGKNSRKIHYIKAMHDAGINVLSDKPLTINRRGVDILDSLLDGGAVIDDIMTERHEVTSILQKELMADKDVFGD